MFCFRESIFTGYLFIQSSLRRRKEIECVNTCCYKKYFVVLL